MRQTKRSRPEVNAGSMADIAFLLLVFFLVTAVIPQDQGFQRKLPRLCEDPPCTVEQHERNVLRILLNGKNQLMINEEVTTLQELSDKVIAFVDNNGDGSCNYCHGLKLEAASENPSKAVISLQSHSEASYTHFIAIQNELTKAYKTLRWRFAQETWAKPIEELSADELKSIKEAYPFVVSEAIARH